MVDNRIIRQAFTEELREGVPEYVALWVWSRPPLYCNVFRIAHQEGDHLRLERGYSESLFEALIHHGKSGYYFVLSESLGDSYKSDTLLPALWKIKGFLLPIIENDISGVGSIVLEWVNELQQEQAQAQIPGWGLR